METDEIPQGCIDNGCGLACKGPSCGVVGKDSYFCTREKGHTGVHRACGNREGDHNICEWDRSEDA